MRIADPLILGAGPAGCAAAITLARGGTKPLLLDRDEQVGDPLCGGFLSWRTLQQLQNLGIDPLALGGHRVTRLRLFDGKRETALDLPHAACGLSRHALDTAMRAKAVALGPEMAFDSIRGIEGATATGSEKAWQGSALLLATGKHDVRGLSRPRTASDTTLGLRLRLPASPERLRLLDGAIELHLFPGGYVGIVLQEGGSANICLAVRKSALAAAGGSPDALFTCLAERNHALAARLGSDWREAKADTIGAVPYGWIARDTRPGLYRLGDQAAVIPSLAGEGISIALASGTLAADYVLAGRSAFDYQRAFAVRASRPVRLASAAWHLAESRFGAKAAMALSRLAPGIIAGFADLARIDAPRALAPT